MMHEDLMGKVFVLVCSLCFMKNWELFDFVLLCKLLHMKTKGFVYKGHLDFRGKICEKEVCTIQG